MYDRVRRMSQLHSHVRYCSDVVSIADVRCRSSTNLLSAEEQTTAHEVVFPRAGVFVRHIGREQHVADSNHVLFFNPNEPYRVSHPVSGGDDCTSFVFSTDILLEALAFYDPQIPDQPERPFRFSQAVLGPKTIIRQQQLRQRLKDGSTSALEVEESAVDLLGAVVASAYRRRALPPTRPHAGTVRLWQQWVESVKLLIATQPGANLSLAEIARSVHCSPFHLARLFRSFVGSSIHDYHLRLRLALALERLLDGPASLTELALDLGFTSHSHFTDTFRRYFDISPSMFRRRASGAQLSKLSKILKV
jgi:AraC family transcriptional regulator